MKLLSQRAKIGVAGAIACASLAGGTGLAEATPAPAAPHGATVHQVVKPDVGVPPEGLAPDALVTAPDGSKVRATDPGAFGKWRAGKQGVAAADSGQSMRITGDGRHAETTVTGARIRASVPYGRVLGLAQTGQWGGTAGCKIPGSDGRLWGWVGFRTTGNGQWTTGWMRSDLFKVWYGTFWSDLRYLPWC
ncbi:hypothetical protein DL991_10760 [Amycolatopsis sp. WAC 01375]|uniref:hypothetical protein n=1 Tax=Amycolatopsis sp. WAC 01375 TaxID=2203194 RepID=UPI000F76F068|nr:hypothetical protein [Amycolatopsis sp. WAC 01375]RSM80583.1 hypothetical protein DL991_10760 [Amycolatopsis sp. WAC 01375]